MNDIVYKDVQITQLAERLGVSKGVVDSVITGYVEYLKSQIEEGHTVRFLNICYLVCKRDTGSTFETLAYTATELSKKLNQSPILVQRVLSEYEEMLILDLKKLHPYTVRGLVRIRLEKDDKGRFVVRIKKSTVYNTYDNYVSTLGSFKRRVEIS